MGNVTRNLLRVKDESETGSPRFFALGGASLHYLLRLDGEMIVAIGCCHALSLSTPTRLGILFAPRNWDASHKKYETLAPCSGIAAR